MATPDASDESVHSRAGSPAALVEPGHVGALYVLTGPPLLTFAEAVDEIGEATGREIRYVRVSPEEYALRDDGAGRAG